MKQAAQKCGFFSHGPLPTIRMTGPPIPPNGLLHCLQRGALGSVRNTARIFRMPGSSPLSSRRQRSAFAGSAIGSGTWASTARA